MQGKNVFNIALSCSVLWHILSVQAVNIIWPDQLIPTNFASINFLGEILKKSEYKEEDLKKKSLENAELNPITGGKEIILETKKGQITKEPLPLAELSQKSTPEVVLNASGQNKFLVVEKIENKNKRTVLLKPALPVYPNWAKEWGSYFEIELKFLILPDGTVANVEKTISSGYPELDEIGVRYIRQWKFVPLSIEQTQSEQWGVIKLVFKVQ